MTLQQHFNLIKEGKGNKDQFLKQARSLFPDYITKYLDYDTSVNVLKSKQIISEAAGGVVAKGFNIYDWKKILGEEVKATEKETSKQVLDAQAHAYDNKDMKNADNVNFNEIMKGFYAELKDEKNKEKSGDEIKAMVVKNLAKDPLYYTKNGEFGTKGVGYTTEAPGLGEPKAPKGKHKSSGYGDLKEGIHDRDILSRPWSNPHSEDKPTPPEELAKAADFRSEMQLRVAYRKEIDDPTISDDELRYILSGKGAPGFGGRPNAIEKVIKDRAGKNMSEGEQKLRSLIQQIIKEELEENYETKKDLAQLQKGAQDIEPKAQKLAKALKGKSTTEISKILKEKGITDSDLITRVIDLAAKK